ncbi:cupin domain-containing protein [Pseudomonas sp. RL]|uniref:cupin domain-containing protein n=1 Tax=Pseudomonas sp. RL TaxID=1452718 RepID=UPI00111588AD
MPLHAGTLWGSHLLQAQGGTGQLHLIRRGPITVVHGSTRLQIDRPSLLLYPRPIAHRFESDPIKRTDSISALTASKAQARVSRAPENPAHPALPGRVQFIPDEKKPRIAGPFCIRRLS